MISFPTFLTNGETVPTIILCTTILAIVLSTILLLLHHKQRRQAKAKAATPSSYKDIPLSILKQGASRPKLKSLTDTYDIILIGSGIGSLTTAIVLTHIGYKCILFEQHDIAGGSTHTFTESGYEFDVGVHYVGGQLDAHNHNYFGIKSMLRRVFDYLTDNLLEWCRMDDTYDVTYEEKSGERLEYGIDHDANLLVLTSHFANNRSGGGKEDGDLYDNLPKKLQSYRRYCSICRGISMIFMCLKILSPFVLKLIWPLWKPIYRQYVSCSVLSIMKDKCHLPPAVIGALVYFFGDYGQTPNKAPFMMQALLDNHWKGGSYYPKGGSKSIARTMVSALERRGSNVFVRCPVEEIVIDDEEGKAVGVKVKGVVIKARKCVVSGAGFRNTFGVSAGVGTPAPSGSSMPKLTEEEDMIDDKTSSSAAEEKKDGQNSSSSSSDTDKRNGNNKPTTEVCWEPLVKDEVFAKAQRSLLHGNAAATKETVGPSLAMVQLFVGLDTTDKELNLPSCNIWHHKDWSNIDSNIEKLEKSSTFDESINPAVFIGMASSKDDAYSTREDDDDDANNNKDMKSNGTVKGKERNACLTVISMAMHNWFDQWSNTRIKHRGTDYLELKERITQNLLTILYQHFPQVKGHVVYTDLGTPLSNDYYLNSKNGEVYGLDHVTERFDTYEAQRALHPQTLIEGLYITGQDSMCVGVVGAMMGGVATAGRISWLALLDALVTMFVS